MAASKLKEVEKKPAAKKKAPAAAPAEKGGAFSLGAESLEEFFGLTKKPRLVSWLAAEETERMAPDNKTCSGNHTTTLYCTDRHHVRPYTAVNGSNLR